VSERMFIKNQSLAPSLWPLNLCKSRSS